MRRTSALICLLAILAAGLIDVPERAFAAESVKIVVPFAPGGVNDLLSRTFATAMSTPGR